MQHHVEKGAIKSHFLRYSVKFNVLQTIWNISSPQNTSFGNTENGCFAHLQGVDYQYSYYSQNNTVSTGKELDPETGYSYFGARYLNHTPLTLWLSVDPMADKYPNISPYAYCAWNPLKLVDPNGEDIYEITLTGQINKVRESENDEFYIIDKNGNRIDGKSLIFSDKIVGGELTLPDKNGGFITYLDIEDGESAKELFEFVSNSCRDNSVEFGWAVVRESEDCSSNLIGFGAQNESHTSANQILVLSGYEINILTHNHPDGLMHPSTSDVDFARNVQKKHPLTSFYIYRIDNTYISYDGTTIIDVPITIEPFKIITDKKQ